MSEHEHTNMYVSRWFAAIMIIIIITHHQYQPDPFFLAQCEKQVFYSGSHFQAEKNWPFLKKKKKLNIDINE